MTNYVNKKGEGSFLTFNKKILYKGKTREDTLDYANLVDFNFGEKFFYGKVQRNFVPMYFDNEVIKLKTINSSVTNGQYFTAMNFVADAFDKLAEQFPLYIDHSSNLTLPSAVSKKKYGVFSRNAFLPNH